MKRNLGLNREAQARFASPSQARFASPQLISLIEEFHQHELFHVDEILRFAQGDFPDKSPQCRRLASLRRLLRRFAPL
jgi:hypothetical protein